MIFNENGKIINEGLFSKIKEKYNNYHKKHMEQHNNQTINQKTYVEDSDIDDVQEDILNKWIETSYKKYYSIAKSNINKLNQKYPEVIKFIKQNSDMGYCINKWMGDDNNMYDVKSDMYKGKVTYTIVISIFDAPNMDELQVAYTNYMDELLKEFDNKNNDKHISFEMDGSAEETIINIIFDINDKIKEI